LKIFSLSLTITAILIVSTHALFDVLHKTIQKFHQSKLRKFITHVFFSFIPAAVALVVIHFNANYRGSVWSCSPSSPSRCGRNSRKQLGGGGSNVFKYSAARVTWLINVFGREALSCWARSERTLVL
jgi:hypothetical protein